MSLLKYWMPEIPWYCLFFVSTLQGCRAINVERKILQKDPNKMIILVLNKIDLVPHDIVEQV